MTIDPGTYLNPPLDILVQAGNARDRDEFVFTVLNRTVGVAGYDRATLWDIGGTLAPVAVSGVEPLGKRSAFVVSWTRLMDGIKEPTLPGRLDGARFERAQDWDAKCAETGGLSALWLPLEGCGFALLFERWGGGVFTEGEEAALAGQARAYARFWPGRKARDGWKWTGRLMRLALLAALASALYFVRVPLRVVAPCEVTARTPHLVAAPMAGVIDEILIKPGQQVEVGTVLAVYDSRMMEEELNISRRQVAVVEAELAAAKARGFNDNRYRGEVALLEARLAQETARLGGLETRYSFREVTARHSGMVQLDDARAWRGRPVSTGQAIMWLVNPSDSRLKVWLPQDDRIEVDHSRPVNVHLHALGGAARRAKLTYVSTFAQPTPDGVYAFPAEAEWLDAEPPPPLGLRGTAAIFGEETRLGHWLFRRPLAWARRWLGI